MSQIKETVAKSYHGFSSDLLWEKLWESTNDRLILVNLEGLVVASNAVMNNMLGANLLGMSLSELFEATGTKFTTSGELVTLDDLIISRVLRGEKAEQKRWFFIIWRPTQRMP